MLAPQKHKPTILDETQMQLAEWLSHVFTPEDQREGLVADYCFPTTKLRDQYLHTCQAIPEGQIKALLRYFLPQSGTYGCDKGLTDALFSKSSEKVMRLRSNNEFIRRLLQMNGPWEGLTWIIDLLPHHPLKALHAIDAYFMAHIQYLPDGRYDGLRDAEAIVRERFLHFSNSQDALMALTFEEFEILIAAIYEHMGYITTLSRRGSDGGIDIVCTRTKVGVTEKILVQCKRYKRNIGVEKLRELRGVVGRQQVNRGIVVTTSGFTRVARNEFATDNALELIDFPLLNSLLNEHFGSCWPTLVSSRIRDYQRKHTIT